MNPMRDLYCSSETETDITLRVTRSQEDETLLRLRDGEGLGWIEISEQGFQGRRTDNSVSSSLLPAIDGASGHRGRRC